MSELQSYKYIAVLLVYRNANDLKECIDSYKAKVDSCKIIVVNSFYDEESKNTIEAMASENECDFLNIENKGYSYGNNKGVEFALAHYDFEYIIISNPDILVKEFDDHCLEHNAVYAPEITARSGRKQNPMVIRQNNLSEKLIYLGMKKNRKDLYVMGILCGKISRGFNGAFKHGCYCIYQAHGSFLILGCDAVKKLAPLYDENMFLFAEEGVLALRLKENGFKTYYWPNIKIFHKEDGSMSLSNMHIGDELRKANIYYYETYRKGKKS